MRIAGKHTKIAGKHANIAGKGARGTNEGRVKNHQGKETKSDELKAGIELTQLKTRSRWQG
jgi:hypothetical protein